MHYFLRLMSIGVIVGFTSISPTKAVTTGITLSNSLSLAETLLDNVITKARQELDTSVLLAAETAKVLIRDIEQSYSNSLNKTVDQLDVQERKIFDNLQVLVTNLDNAVGGNIKEIDNSVRRFNSDILLISGQGVGGLHILPTLTPSTKGSATIPINGSALSKLEITSLTINGKAQDYTFVNKDDIHADLQVSFDSEIIDAHKDDLFMSSLQSEIKVRDDKWYDFLPFLSKQYKTYYTNINLIPSDVAQIRALYQGKVEQVVEEKGGTAKKEYKIKNKYSGSENGNWSFVVSPESGFEIVESTVVENWHESGRCRGDRTKYKLNAHTPNNRTYTLYAETESRPYASCVIKFEVSFKQQRVELRETTAWTPYQNIQLNKQALFKPEDTQKQLGSPRLAHLEVISKLDDAEKVTLIPVGEKKMGILNFKTTSSNGYTYVDANIE